MIYDIVPRAKPRMTSADKYKKRKIVQEYWAYKKEIQLKRVQLREAGEHITFVMPMPWTWSKKKRTEMDGQPHQQVPDFDNLHKGLLDAVFDEDCRVWDHRITKVWGEKGAIKIEPMD